MHALKATEDADSAFLEKHMGTPSYPLPTKGSGAFDEAGFPIKPEAARFGEGEECD